MDIKFVGVLNTTPDSFSDGGLYLDIKSAVSHAKKLIADGADIIDVGADSTRPGSTCVEANEEWSRLRDILPALLEEQIPFAVDTHIAETARRAIDAGAVMVNDVSAGYDEEMFGVISEYPQVQYVMMYSRCIPPHSFAEEVEGDIVEVISDYFSQKIEIALASGVDREQLIIDPGMGKFISDNPERSWKVLRELSSFSKFNLPLYVGASRKGFLKLPHEQKVVERDYLSSVAGKVAIDGALGAMMSQIYIRTHNIALQKQILRTSLV